MKNNRLIVTLGMHRSGTSAMTRALQVFGVHLGDNLLPPLEDNIKGFWEDADFVALNDELLAAVGNAWHYLTPIQSDDVHFLRQNGYFLRAVELLRQKMNSGSLIGLKDPRTTKLLPFWRAVFDHCEIKVSYVLAMRHPVSTVKSLAARNGFEVEKCYLLWLGHVIESLSSSIGKTRVLVDFDRLMHAPEREISRMAIQLNLEVNAAELQIYETEYLDKSLRHTNYELNDLLLDPACPPLVSEIYIRLLDIASDNVSIDDPSLEKQISLWTAEFMRTSQSLMLSDRYFVQRLQTEQTVAERSFQVTRLDQALGDAKLEVVRLHATLMERETRIGILDHAIPGYESRIIHLEKTLTERETRIGILDQAVAGYDSRIIDLEKTLTERETRIGILDQAVADYNSRIVDLEKTLTERDMRIEILDQTVADYNNRIVDLEKTLFDRNEHIVSLNNHIEVSDKKTGTLENHIRQLAQKRDCAVHERNLTAQKLADIESSTFWKMTHPLRSIAVKVPIVRRVGRPSAKLIWWMITGKLIRKNSERRMAPDRSVEIKQNLMEQDVPQITQDLPESVSPLDTGQDNSARIEESDYDRWIREHDTLSAEDIVQIHAHIARLVDPPLISVVMPAYETPEALLREAIASVRAQFYPHWELCICDDASPSEYVARVLEEEARNDSRIRWVRREKNGHICAATNDAIALANGKYVALMDHDDLLPPHALYSVAVELMAHPETDMLFTDEDRISDSGQRHSPYFKPGWNPELLLSQNFVCHLGVYRRALLNEIGALREGFEGSQDYDLALRFSALVNDDHIRHLPGILYHWRLSESENTPSFSQSQLDRCADAARRAVVEYLNDRGDFHGLGAIVSTSPVLASWSRIRWPLPDQAPKVSIIVPTRDHHELLAGCAEGLLKRTDYPNFELLIADNGSIESQTLELFSQLSTDPRVRVLSLPGPFNYSAINNAAAREATGEILVLLNNDIEIIGSDWLQEMVSIVIRPEVGAVGTKLLYANGTVQHAGVVLGIGSFNGGPGVAGHYGVGDDRNAFGYFGQNVVSRDLCAVTAACLAVRRKVFENIGGLDEKNLSVAFNDVDFCLRVRASGLRNIWTPYAEMFHLESASRGSDAAPEKVKRFGREAQYMRDQWAPLLDNDPFYNQVFSRWGPLFAMTRPSRTVFPWQV